MTMTTSPGTMSTGMQPGTGGLAPRPPQQGRRGDSSWARFSRKHARALAIGLVALVVVALAVPVGLARLSTGGGSSSEASVAGVAPAPAKRDAGSAAGSVGSSGSAGSAGAPADSGAAQSPGASTGAASAGGGLLTPEAAAALEATKIARTAWLGLQVNDLAGSAGRARIIASGAGGTVLSEDVVTAVDPGGTPTDGAPGTGPDGIPTKEGATSGVLGSTGTWPPVGLHQARMTLSVPADKLDTVLTQLSGLGTVSYRSAQAEDVTASYVDTQARIGPARDSIERVRALMAKATDLQQLLVLESELTRRQSDLDSLTQQLADIEKRTTMSQVTVAMWTPAAADVADQGSSGVGGLRGAWEALLASLSVVLTGLAVLLPWLLLLGLGAWITLRVVRRRRAAVVAPVAPSPSAGSPAPVPATSPTSPPQGD
jgi:Domain of unknown function (DUF4349)